MAVGAIVPLLILVGVVAIGAYIGYHILIWSNELADRGKKGLEKKNMSFTADGGLRVGVKEMSNESYADKTQNILVNTWNNASFPAYKSRLGWNSSQEKKPSPSASPRPGASRENSEPKVGASRSSSAALRPPEPRSSAKRGSSPLPGGWD